MTTSLAGRHWFSTAQAAEYAGVSTKTIRRALEAGRLKGGQDVPGGKWHIHRDDLDAWLRGESAAA